MNAIVSSPTVREKLSDMGNTATTSTPDEFAREIKRDLERYRPIIRNAGIRAE